MKPLKDYQRFRLFEDRLFSYPIHGPERGMEELRRFLRRVWADLKPSKPIPVVVAGRGHWVAKTHTLASYELGGRIVLARHHRYRIILLHEVAHYLADDPYPYHGLKFFKVYRNLLLKYSDVKTASLINTLAQLYSLPVKRG